MAPERALGRVVLIGAGHAHLHTLKRLAEFVRRGHEAVVVAPDRFWYSGLATGMLGGAYPPELDQVDVAALVERGGGRFVTGRLVAIDRVARRVTLDAAAQPIAYDALSLTLGSVPPPIDGASEEGVFAVKPVRRLWELRQHLEARFGASGEPVRVVVAGGGVTACEIAANVAALAERRRGRCRIVVLAGGRDVLRQLPSRRAARKLVAALERRGIGFRHEGSRVERIDGSHAILASGERISFDVFVNATGLVPAPLMRGLGLPVDAEGGLIVDDRLRSIADPRIHAAGDCIAFDGHALPRIGVYAIRQAPVLFGNLLAALDGTPPTRFVPQRKYLWIMNLGDGTGLAARRPFYWHGRAAFRLKDWIDRRFLAEYQDAAAGRG